MLFRSPRSSITVRSLAGPVRSDSGSNLGSPLQRRYRLCRGRLGKFGCRHGRGPAARHPCAGTGWHSDFTEAKTALDIAHTVFSTEHTDPLHHRIAGEFAFGTAKLHYYEALVLTRAGYPTEAEAAAATAVTLYQAAPDTARSYGCEALARLQLAVARLMSGQRRECRGGHRRLAPPGSGQAHQ